MTARVDKIMPLVSVYDRSRIIGFILNRGRGGFEAFDAEEGTLGLYPSMKAAADVISLERST